MTARQCHMCGGPAGKDPALMVRIDVVTRVRSTHYRCRQCDTQGATGLRIGSNAKALDAARKRGTRNSARARAR